MCDHLLSPSSQGTDNWEAARLLHRLDIKLAVLDTVERPHMKTRTPRVPVTVGIERSRPHTIAPTLGEPRVGGSGWASHHRQSESKQGQQSYRRSSVQELGGDGHRQWPKMNTFDEGPRLVLRINPVTMNETYCWNLWSGLY